jgi:internalin A
MMNRQFSIFISFTLADEKIKYELIRSIQVQLEKEVQIIGDTKARRGTELMVFRDWAFQADIIFILLSKAYFEAIEIGNQFSSKQSSISNSQEDVYYNLKMAKKEGKRVIPILLDDCPWENSPFAPYLKLPLNDKPLFSFSNVPEALEDIVRATRSILDLIANPQALELIETEKNQESGALNLSDLGLLYIPVDIYDMDWLKTLKMDRNQISRIEYLENLTNLEHVSFEKNRIEKIENLDHLIHLKELNLTENQISKIENLNGLAELKRLELRHNQIKKLNGLNSIKSLEILGVSNNQLSELEGVQSLKSLSVLYASYNQIKEVDALEQLDKLQRIVLTSNQISSIKPLLGHIKNGLNVVYEYDFDESNPGIFIKDNTSLSEPSLEVIQQGRESILKYFSDADQYGIEKLELIKMILVGNSRVGKTNFSQFLRSGKIDLKSKSTHLLDIQAWEAPFLKSANNKLTRVAIFDFGGQDYYHDSHRLYYSHDTAYVLIWDAISNKYEKIEEKTTNSGEVLQFENFPLEYWLESIRYNLRDKSQSIYLDEDGISSKEKKDRILPPVLILQNKIDLLEGKLDQQLLCNDYPMIWGYFNVSLAKNKRTAVLNELLSDYFWSLNLSGRKIVTYEMEVIRHFLKEEKPLEILSLDEFYALCLKIINDPAINFNLDNAIILAQILSNSGLLLFEKIEDGGWIYTNVQELNMLVKEVMELAKDGNQKGIFNRKQIKGIKNYEQVIGLLIRNNSIIEINDQEFLAPQFLPVKPDTSIEFFLTGFTYTQVRFVYKAFFHKTLILNLFAKFLQKENIDTTLGVRSFPFWRNGIIVKKGDGITSPLEMVFVEFSKNERFGLVNIKTMQPYNKNGLEKEIVETLDELNQDWTVEKQMSSDGIHFFDVDKIKKQVINKQFSFTHTLDYDNCDLKEWTKWESKLSGKTPMDVPQKVFSVNDFKEIENFENLPKKLFISYSSKNSSFVKRFVTHLEVLKNKGKIDQWYDRMIEAGTRWDDSIKEEMNRSDLIIFMLSPDFLATEYIMKVEVPLALKNFGPTKKLFFIELLPCGWEQTEMFQYQQTGNFNETNKNILTVETATNDAKWKVVVNELLKKLGAE